MLALLKRRERPLAVLAIDAYTAWGGYEASWELGLRIPQDVSVVGFDDSQIAHTMRPPMTIVSQRTDEISRTAVELLERRIHANHDDEKPPSVFARVVVDVDLIECQSVASVAGGQPSGWTTSPYLFFSIPLGE